MRVLPLEVREWLFFRYYRRRSARYAALFDGASLALAPGVTMALSPTDIAHQAIALTGVYETQLSRRIARLARAGGLLVDVGANFGYYSCLWAAAHPQNRVIAYEPSPVNNSAALANFRQNELSQHIDLRSAALGYQPGVMRFRRGPAEQTGQGGFAAAQETSDYEVQVTTLDSLLDEQPSLAIAAVKIDAEGADTWVLEGARRLLLARRVRHLFFEQLPERMRPLGIVEGRAFEFLEACGYQCRQIAPDLWHATAR
jgi:FkbM family methyltransferase